MADTNKLISVKAAPSVGERVVLWEVDERHPANSAGAHEAYVAGQDSDPQQVYPTSKVLNALKDETLIAATAIGKEVVAPALRPAPTPNTPTPNTPTPNTPTTTPTTTPIPNTPTTTPTTATTPPPSKPGNNEG